MDSALKLRHDELLTQIPEGAEHVAESCPLCNGSVGGDLASLEGGVMGTYTDEELAVKVSEAVAPLQTKIQELMDSHEQAELEAKVLEATTPLNEQIAELQSKLDAAVLEVEAAKTELAEMVSFMETAAAEAALATELAARRDERIAKVKEVASFPDEHIEANADRWAALDEEAFEAALADWKLISAKPAKKDEKVPAETALSGASPETASTASDMGLIREVMNMTIRGIDPRRV